MPDAVPPGRPPDLDEKLARLAALAAARGVRTLVLRDPATLAWLLSARVHVPQTLDTACLDVVVELGAPGGTALTVVTSAIEAPRLRDAELGGLDADWRVVPWWDDRAAALPAGPAVGSDRPVGGSADVAADLVALRRVLTTEQQERLRQVGRDCAQAATAAAHALTPSTTGYEAAGALARELLDRALDPVVLLVAGDGAVGRHRHPLPTTDPLGGSAQLVACGRRHGLVASVTRSVQFRPLASADDDAYLRLLAVEAAFLDATRAGARLGDVVAAGVAAYAGQGFPADEWHHHHQGGLTGVQPREFPASPTSDVVLPAGCAVAWNPSAGRWKVEDTCLVGDSGVEPVVHDPAWPTVEVAGRHRPGVLVRSDVAGGAA